MAALLLAGCLSSVSAYADAGLVAANADLQAGKADEAIALLGDALKSDPGNAEANNLLCRVEYALQQFDQAAGHCEKATAASPQSSLYHLWLGRAIGERASRVSFLSAFSLAKKTREEFETAVKLDPRNADALSDLGEFYEDAPGAVGGGVDKAADIAAKLDSVDPTRAHKLRAEIAEKNKDFATVEKELKAAIASTSHPAPQWMWLASFYRRRERWSDLDAAIKSGEAAAARDKHSAVALFNGGSVLVRANRQPDVAIKLYQGYLASPDKTEEGPAFEAMLRLAKLLSQTGDQAGAERERAAALALAHEYKPAQELRF
jgi:tetratricopeptide (TPR) repeat protein